MTNNTEHEPETPESTPAAQAPVDAAAPVASDSAATEAAAPAASEPAGDTAPQATVYTAGAAPAAYGEQPNAVGADADGQVPPPVDPSTAGYPYIQAPPAKPARTKRGSLPVAATIAIAALVGGGVGAGVVGVSVAMNGSSTTTNTTQQKVSINNTDSVTAVSAVAAAALPSVVTIQVSSSSSAGTGSGVIISSDGYIVTNTHVVTLDGETSNPTITVITSDGTQYSGKLIGTDPNSDLAVVQIKASNLTPINFADSDSLNVGQTTIAIGAPMELSNTVTQGIVSALYRGISIASSAPSQSSSSSSDGSSGSGSPFQFWNNQGQSGSSSTSSTATISLSVIQTDAAINPGNSGGALLDTNGKLIGINVAILSSTSSSSDSTAGSIGIGFAIPSNQVKRVAQEIINSGTATHGLLGASVTDTSTTDSTEGAVVKSVTSGGPAASAGVQAGDIVTEFDGVRVTSATDLTAIVRAQAAGSKGTITVVRNGQTHTFNVTLGSYSG